MVTLKTSVIFQIFLATVGAMPSILQMEQHPPLYKGFEGKKADIYFVVDTSGSVGRTNYRKLLSFVADMVRQMDISPLATRVGLGTFSDKFRPKISLNDDLGKEGLVDKIKNVTYDPESGILYKALSGARTIGLSQNVVRKDVPQVMIIFSDDRPAYKQRALNEATIAKKDRIFTYVIGLGAWARMDGSPSKLDHSLSSLASDPKTEYAFWADRLESLVMIKDKLMTSIAAVEFLQADKGNCLNAAVADVQFIFDELALGQNGTDAVHHFITSTVKNLNIDSGHVRVGVTSKNTGNQKDISLVDYLKAEDLIARLNDDSGPDIQAIVRRARLRGFLDVAGGRAHAQKRMVIFTFGRLKHPDSLSDELSRALFGKIEVFLIKIGDDTEINKILSDLGFSNSHTIALKSVEELTSEDTRKRFNSQFCLDKA